MDAALSAADHFTLDIHSRIERWALDGVALPGKLVSEIVEELYRENRFCRGILRVGEKVIGPSCLLAPTLAIVNAADAVAPLASLSPIRDVLGSDKFHILEYPGETGVCLQHLAILVGREAFARIWPEVTSWIFARGSEIGAPAR
jgi:polyhydroxyalkanoate synthase